MRYEHLSLEEREVLSQLAMCGVPQSVIARDLGRDKGTISRELRRNRDSQGDYQPHLAQRYYRQRRRAAKAPYRLEEDVCLELFVRNQLEAYWSPEQISGWLGEKVQQQLSAPFHKIV